MTPEERLATLETKIEKHLLQVGAIGARRLVV